MKQDSAFESKYLNQVVADLAFVVVLLPSRKQSMGEEIHHEGDDNASQEDRCRRRFVVYPAQTFVLEHEVRMREELRGRSFGSQLAAVG